MTCAPCSGLLWHGLRWFFRGGVASLGSLERPSRDQSALAFACRIQALVAGSPDLVPREGPAEPPSGLRAVSVLVWTKLRQVDDGRL